MSPAAWTAGALAVAAFAASWVLTRAVRRYAKARLLDVPNERSSHARPVPRGGGLAVVLAFGSALAALALLGVVEGPLALALLGGGVLIAGIGWLDDHYSIPARWRVVVHFAAAGWALWMLGGLPSLRLGVAEVPLGPVGWVLGALGIVWVTNLYNFMDGIDGIAGGQALSVGAAACVLLAWAGHPGLAAAALLLAASSAGFLVWNWHPARIFMGDVGSGTLGYWIAVLAVASENAGAVPLMGWAVLMGVFIVDATATLLRRLMRGERVYEAHCSHAYQRAVRAGLSHARVSGAVVLLNLALAGIVLAAVLNPRWLLPGVLASLALLGWVYVQVERRHPMR